MKIINALLGGILIIGAVLGTMSLISDYDWAWYFAVPIGVVIGGIGLSMIGKAF